MSYDDKYGTDKNKQNQQGPLKGPIPDKDRQDQQPRPGQQKDLNKDKDKKSW